jgi:hypothetical protein
MTSDRTDPRTVTKECEMFPVSTIDIVTTERTRRLEGYRAWSHRQGRSAGPEAADTVRPDHGHRPSLRIAFGR